MGFHRFRRALVDTALILSLGASAPRVHASGCALHDGVKADASMLPATVLVLPPVIDMSLATARGTTDLGQSSNAEAMLRHELDVRLTRRHIHGLPADEAPIDVNRALRDVVKSGATGEAKLAWAKQGPIRKGAVSIGPVLAAAARDAGAEGVLHVELHATAMTGGAAFLGAHQGSSLDAWLIRAEDGVVLYHGVSGEGGSPLGDFGRTLDFLLAGAFVDLPTRPVAGATEPATMASPAGAPQGH